MSATLTALTIGSLLLSFANGGTSSSSGILQEGERTEVLNGSINTTPSPLSLTQMMAELKHLDSTFKNSCIEDVMAFISALTSSEPPTWALSMLDSFGKPGSYLLKGNIRWSGSYSQCRSVVQEKKATGRPFHGEFCWAYFEMQNKTKQLVMPGSDMDVTFSLGLCAPNTCTEAQLMQAVKLYTDWHPVPFVNDYVKLTEMECLKRPTIWESKSDTITLYIFVILVLLVCGATCYDLWKEFGPTRHKKAGLPPNNTSQAYSSLLVFSAYSNGKKLLKLDGGRQCLPAVNGIRMMSLIWVVTGHTILSNVMLSDNLQHFVDESHTIHQISFAQAIYAVYTFFFLSGFLVAYAYLNEHKRSGGRIPWAKFYFHRFWRLTPTYFLVIWFMTISLTKYLAHGPFWKRAFEESAICQNYWWANMFYVNNFMPSHGQCMGHTFYLANDMQFYLISPLLLIPFTRSVRSSIIVSVLMIALACVVSGIMGIAYEVPISMDLKQIPIGSDKHTKIYNLYYIKPYNRIAPYLVGMVTGWILHRKNSIPMPKMLVALGWTICLLTLVTLVYVTKFIDDIFAVRVLHHIFHQAVWGACIAWIVIACCSGYGGIINRFLSMSIWNPLSRLAYCTYLWHNGSIFTRTGQIETLLHSNVMELNMITLRNIIISFAEAVFLSLLFEAPFVGLEASFMRKKKPVERKRDL